MTPKRLDVNILCSKCQKPISGEHRSMMHDGDKWYYSVDCHGAVDSGPHLAVRAHEDSHGVTLMAFPSPPTSGPKSN